ncbi:MAG: fimbria/pilus periplasmic chaperone [Gallionella sp.]|nr:molecular chaperone [Gallionella sp.]
MKNNMTKLLTILLASSLAMPVLATPFSVTPVRIYMTPKDKAIAVTVTNEGDEELVMQADVYSWKQKPDGEDDLVLTEDLLLSPPIIKLAAKARQVVRLARLRSVPLDEQLTYRLIMREVPEAKPNKGDLQLQIALAFSLPVFITSPTAKSVLGCTAQRSTADTVKVSCENTGKAYAQLVDLELSNAEGKVLASREGGGYILPANKRQVDIKSADKAIPSGKAKLNVRLDDGTQQAFDVTIAE